MHWRRPAAAAEVLALAGLQYQGLGDHLVACRLGGHGHFHAGEGECWERVAGCSRLVLVMYR